MNNAAHVATGGEVSDHHSQEVPSIAKLRYQWRADTNGKSFETRNIECNFSCSRGGGCFNNGIMACRYVLPTSYGSKMAGQVPP